MSSIHARESEFHDQWARSLPPDQIPVRPAFESPTAMENRYILSHMGDLSGKRLLDIGCGLGESSVYFALRGAQVTATDLSPEMVRSATELARFHNTSIEALVSPAESLGVPDDHFDFVYIANTIHHVSDRPRLFQQIHRALKPGGRFFSIDPLAYNPLINVYRRMATQVRTEDERPLTFADLSLARQYFTDVTHREFWIASLTLFLKYYLVNRVHPNADRYWKRIYRETTRSLWWWYPLKSLDRLLTRLSLVRRLAWNIVITGRK